MVRIYNILKQNKVSLVYVPLVLYWIILLILTSIPLDWAPRPDFKWFDKVEHFIAYFILACLLGLTLHFQNKNTILKEKFVIYSFFVVSMYGILDEIHQYFIPGRFFDVFDILADVLGALFGVFLLNIFVKKSNSFSKFPGTNF